MLSPLKVKIKGVWAFIVETLIYGCLRMKISIICTTSTGLELLSLIAINKEMSLIFCLIEPVLWVYQGCVCLMRLPLYDLSAAAAFY